MKTCYKVLIRLVKKADKSQENIAYEVLAEHPTEAEDMVISGHSRDWDKDYLFEGVQAVFPCDEAAS